MLHINLIKCVVINSCIQTTPSKLATFALQRNIREVLLPVAHTMPPPLLSLCPVLYRPSWKTPFQSLCWIWGIFHLEKLPPLWSPRPLSLPAPTEYQTWCETRSCAVCSEVHFQTPSWRPERWISGRDPSSRWETRRRAPGCRGACWSWCPGWKRGMATAENRRFFHPLLWTQAVLEYSRLTRTGLWKGRRCIEANLCPY